MNGLRPLASTAHAAAHCVFWLLLSLSPSAAGQAAPVTDEEIEASVRELVALAKQLRPGIDRARFELEPLLDARDYEADEIVDFVSNEIAFEAYAGALRGARGTLISRAGNSLDQSLLLATLLRDAGYDAVIRRGELNETAVDALVASMFPRPEAMPSSPPPAAAEPLDSVPTLDRNDWVRAARAKTDHLLEALERAGIELGGQDVVQAVRDDARDYFWVDYRDGPSADWQSVHPAFPGGVDVEATGTFAGAVPAELSHLVTIELDVVQRRGANVTTGALFTPIRLVSANLTGRPIKLALLPDQLANGNNPIDVETWTDHTRFLLPMIDGKLPAGAQALSLRGLLVPVDSLALGAAGVFETASEKGAQAIDALGALGRKDGEQPTAVAIEALRLRVTLRSPDGRERVVTRELFDEQRDLERASQSGGARRRALVEALARDYTLVFATGRYDEQYVLDGTLNQVESFESMLPALDEHGEKPCETLGCLARLSPQEAEAGAAAGIIYRGFDGVDDVQPDVVAYRHLPNILSVSRDLLPDPTTGAVGQRMDIISNSKRALSMADGRLEAQPRAQVLRGVWETQIETDLVPRPDAAAPSPPQSLGTLRHFDRAEVAPRAEGNAVARAMLRDLDDGYAVLADASLNLARPDLLATRWWRIDPASGETLGMTSLGGAVSTEALTLIAGGLVLAAGNAATVGICLANKAGTLKTCMICENILSAMFITAGSAIDALMSGAMDRTGYFRRELNRRANRCQRRLK